MRRFVFLFLVFTLFFPSVSIFAEELNDDTLNIPESTKEINYIEYDLEKQEKSIIKIGDTTNLGSKRFEYQGKQGNGEKEKINLDEIIDRDKPVIDPLTREELGKRVNPFVIIGDDGRHQVQNTTIMPYRAMTYIQFDSLFSVAMCSGGVIADDLVVTNAHCIDNSILRATVIPGMNNTQFAYGAYTVTHIIVPEEFSETDAAEYDYAILRVAPDENGNSIGERAGVLSWMEAGTIEDNTLLKTYGYPGDKMDETGEISLWGMEGRSAFSNPSMLFYNMDTFSGQSGSPVLNSSNRMIGVHNGAYGLTNGGQINGGPKIRRDFTNLFNYMVNQ
ncbi:trypsin-like peptidase domain-containing protein [Ornithinibacillus sp. BX22]|uniref:Serine protease n=1 Tax=Ornithinibacillus hominis TaxID=2763055 RepID=A0A923L4R9_9BACI|nr:trypsin-like serine protease [Ornithinibacillus hominis]MBC5636447.1 trypsin-like peptidase domain-containing protein [Ornithinibacillus hominis]